MRAAAGPREALFGELVTVYEERDGWAWVQLERDGYVGYLRAVGAVRADQAADAPGEGARHVSLSIGRRQSLPVDAAQHEFDAGGGGDGPDFRQARGRQLRSRPPHRRARPLAPDFVAVAEAFHRRSLSVGRQDPPRRRLLRACCRSPCRLPASSVRATATCSRRELGTDVPIGDDLDGLMRGDIVFWKGHVGIMVDAYLLLHANAHHMGVVVEPLGSAVDRIARAGLAIAAIRRLENKGA